ncbi:hypothetical protein [Bradyrhizobium sp. WSM2793]|uniref:hypothetical protein n=1 Tax=Bradyrhizobium sp. WSM2793 TaxID=1038866 RepID=UPI00039EF268|nr:hypothetical protein [Bradyrhizobium sp. WSM2793]
MSITEGVVAQVRFVDFRLFGGRAYANRRLRFVREVVCRYLTRCCPILRPLRSRQRWSAA